MAQAKVKFTKRNKKISTTCLWLIPLSSAVIIISIMELFQALWQSVPTFIDVFQCLFHEKPLLLV